MGTRSNCATPARLVRGATLVATVLVLTLVGACQSVSPPVSSPEQGSLTPLGDHHRQRLAEAMAGLLYSDGRVRVAPGADTWVLHDPARAMALVATGTELLEKGRCLDAIRTLTEAVLAAPELAQPYHGLGRALITKGKSPEALAAFATALGLDQNLGSARFDLANTLHRLGRLDQAIAVWQELVTADSEHGPAHARLAVGHYLAGNETLARQHLTRAAALNAPVPAQLAALLDTGRPPMAVVRPGDEGSTEIGDQVRVDLGAGTAGANETTAATTDSSEREIVAAWNDYREPGLVRTGVGVSLDGGETWSDFLVRPPVANQTGIEGDPMTAYDQRTDTLWVGGMAFLEDYGGVFVARRQAGSASFEPAVMTIVSGAVDKGWMAAGRLPDNPDSTRLYLTYNLGLQDSSDLGDTWSSVRPIASGLGFLPRVGPAGELYILYWDYWSGIMMRRSFDGGTTLTPPSLLATRLDPWDVYDNTRFPGSFRVPPINYLAVDPQQGTLYCVWFDTTEVSGGNSNVDLYFMRSEDQGDTWSTPTVINGDNDPPGDQFFPWLEVDRSGRIHLLFYDTRHTVQNDTDAAALVDAYYSFSDDQGDTWTEFRLTPSSFDSTFSDSGSGQFMGDYSGLALGGSSAYPVYMSTQNGDRDIFTHTIVTPLFSDGFETGDISAWSGG